MFLEYQLSAETLARNIRNQLLGGSLGAGTSLDYDGEQLMVDRVQLLEPTELVRRPQTFIISTNDGRLNVSGYKASLALSVQVDLVKVLDLLANSGAASEPFRTLQFKAFIDVTVSAKNNQAHLKFAFESIDFGPAGALLDDTQREQINGLVATQVTSIDRVIDIHAIRDLLGGAPVSITNAGATTNSDGNMLVVRIEVNGDGNQFNAWTKFFNSYQRNFVSASDWALLIDEQLLRESISGQVRDGLAAASDKFSSDGNVNASWTWWASSFNVTFSGEAIDACTCLWGEIDVDVDLATLITLSVPSPDVLRLRLKIDYDVDNLEVFCCALTAALFWPVVGIIYTVKSPAAALGWLVGPLGVFIAACAIASDQSLVNQTLDGLDLGGTPNEVDGATREWDVPFAMNMGVLGGTYHLSQMLPLPDGPLLLGSVSDLSDLTNSALQITKIEPFTWRNEGSCNKGWDHPPVQEARLFWTTTQPDSYLNVSQARVIDDPRGIFSMAWWPGIGATITAHPTPLYLANPYPCRVMIVSNGGVRIVSLPTAAALEQSETDGLKRLADMARAGCYVAVNKQPWSIARYRWLPDPSPLDKIAQLWQVVVAQLPAGTEVRLVDTRHKVLASAVAGRRGAAQLSYWSGLDHAMEEVAIHIQGAPDAKHAAARATKCHVSVKQIQLALRSRLPIDGQFNDFAVIRDDRKTVVSMTSSAGSWRYDISRLEAPSLLDSHRTSARPAMGDVDPVLSITKRSAVAQQLVVARQKVTLRNRSELADMIVPPPTLVSSIEHTQQVKMAGTKAAICVRDRDGLFTIRDTSDPKKSRDIGRYFHTPWFFEAKRCGQLLVKLSDNRQEMMVYEIVQTKEM